MRTMFSYLVTVDNTEAFKTQVKILVHFISFLVWSLLLSNIATMPAKSLGILAMIYAIDEL